MSTNLVWRSLRTNNPLVAAMESFKFYALLSFLIMSIFTILVSTIPFCPSSFVKCNSNDKCVSKMWLCDGEPDCPDGTDESDCATTEPCQGFDCGPECIPHRLKCDGISDCQNEADEKYCGQPTIAIPPIVYSKNLSNATTSTLNQETENKVLEMRNSTTSNGTKIIDGVNPSWFSYLPLHPLVEMTVPWNIKIHSAGWKLNLKKIGL